MKAAIHNQYLDTLGGGERYTLFFAKALKELGFDVYVEWYDTEILDKSKNKFGESFDFIKIVDDIKRGDGYDLTLWISDGSIPTLRSRKNIIHFQVPFRGVNGNSLINKMKLYRVNKIICNSLFTKKIIDHEYGVKSLIVYPPVDTKNIKPLKKENIILFVGRFSGLMQSKGQHVLVEVFKKMYQKGDLKNWKLILAGGTEVGVDGQINKLKKMSTGCPVFIIENPPFRELTSLYGRAKIFWSAAGYDIDEKKDPQKMEHFGMAVVESMAGGAVPLIFSGGGHNEIVKNKVNGLLWNKKSDLVRDTLEVIKNKNQYDILSKNAVKLADGFGYEKFKENIKEIIK